MRAGVRFQTVGHPGGLKSDLTKCSLLLSEAILSQIVTVPLANYLALRRSAVASAVLN